MDIRELKDGEIIELIDGINYRARPFYGGPDEEKLIKMEIITDGVLSKNIEEKLVSPKKYQFDKSKAIEDKYFSKDIEMGIIHMLKVKKVCLKDYSYAIVLLSKKELDGSKISYVCKDAYLYLKNINDKKALKSARDSIKAINKKNKLSKKSKVYDEFSLIRESPAVYTFKKK